MPVSTMTREEAFGFPKPKSYDKPTRKNRGRACQLSPRFDLIQPGEPLAVDCEGVTLPKEAGKKRQGLGRVSIVTLSGKVVYDTFCYYPEEVGAHPPPKREKLGVHWADIKPWNGAQPHAQVLDDVRAVFDKAGFVVGHALHHDINFLRPINFTAYETRDTQLSPHYQNCLGTAQPGLKKLSEKILHWNIQGDDHSSVEDAQATMRLYLLQRDATDAVQSKTAIAAAAAAAAAAIAAAAQAEVTFSTGLSPHSSTPSLSSGTTDLTVSTASTTSPPNLMIKMTVAEMGRLVALPELTYLAKGRTFDKRIPRYV